MVHGPHFFFAHFCSTDSFSNFTFTDIPETATQAFGTLTGGDTPTATLIPITLSPPPSLTPSNATLTQYFATRSIPTLSNTTILTESVVLGTASLPPNLTLTAPDVPTRSLPTASNTTELTLSVVPVTASNVSDATLSFVPVTETHVPVTLTVDPQTLTLPETLTPSIPMSVLCGLNATVTAPPRHPHPEQPLQLVANYSLNDAACEPPAAELVSYAWECARVPAGPGRGPAEPCGAAFESRGRVLALKPGALAEGFTYQFTLALTVAEWGPPAVARAAVEPRLQGLVARLEPRGEMVDVRDGPLTLDATPSYDPAPGPGQAYQFRWEACLMSSSRPCAVPSPNPFAELLSAATAVVQLPTDAGLAGQRWQFTVVYADAARAWRAATASVELAFVAVPVLRVTGTPTVAASPDPTQAVVAGARVAYGAAPVSSGALEVAWRSATLDVARASLSGRTDRLSLALPPAALAQPHTLTLTVTAPNGVGGSSTALQQRMVFPLPLRRPPALAAQLPANCGEVLSVNSTDAVLEAGSGVRIAVCEGAVYSPAGHYPLRYYAAAVDAAGVEYPIGAVSGDAGALWRVPPMPATGAAPYALRFALWVYDATGDVQRFDVSRTLPLTPAAAATLVPEAERLLRPASASPKDVLYSSVMLEAAATDSEDPAISRLADLALARIAALPDAAFAEVPVRPALSRAVQGLLHARLRANASADSGLDAFSRLGRRAIGRIARGGPVAAATPLAVRLANALAVLLRTAVVRAPVLDELAAATADVHRALSLGLAAAQHATVAAEAPYAACGAAAEAADCGFALGVARDEPYHLLRAAHATPAGQEVSWGQPVDAALLKRLEDGSAEAWGHVVDLQMSAGPLHRALRASTAALLPPPGALTQSLTLNAVRGLAANATVPVANLSRGSRVSLGFPWAAAGAGRCSFWDAAAGAWSDAGVETVVGDARTTCLSDHLTAFALALPQAPSPSPSPGTSLSGAAGWTVTTTTVLVLALLGGIVVLALLLVLCAWCYFSGKRKKAEDVTVHPELVTPGPCLALTPGETPGPPSKLAPGAELSPVLELEEPAQDTPDHHAPPEEPVYAAPDQQVPPEAPTRDAPDQQGLPRARLEGNDADARRCTVAWLDPMSPRSRPVSPEVEERVDPADEVVATPTSEAMPKWSTFSSALAAWVNADVADSLQQARKNSGCSGPAASAATALRSGGSAHTNPLSRPVLARTLSPAPAPNPMPMSPRSPFFLGPRALPPYPYPPALSPRSISPHRFRLPDNARVPLRPFVPAGPGPLPYLYPMASDPDAPPLSPEGPALTSPKAPSPRAPPPASLSTPVRRMSATSSGTD